MRDLDLGERREEGNQNQSNTERTSSGKAERRGEEWSHSRVYQMDNVRSCQLESHHLCLPLERRNMQRDVRTVAIVKINDEI